MISIRKESWKDSNFLDYNDQTSDISMAQKLKVVIFHGKGQY